MRIPEVSSVCCARVAGTASNEATAVVAMIPAFLMALAPQEVLSEGESDLTPKLRDRMDISHTREAGKFAVPRT
jgi:hypothetical protein